MEGSNLKFLWVPDIAHKYSLRDLEKKVGVGGRGAWIPKSDDLANMYEVLCYEVLC